MNKKLLKIWYFFQRFLQYGILIFITGNLVFDSYRLNYDFATVLAQGFVLLLVIYWHKHTHKLL